MITFNGFISYSHAADGRLAPAVQRGLHRLAKPWHRRRALWIFRDQTGLSVTPALWSSIQSALDGSEYFVLLASPEAAQSPWVNREIEHWTATKPAARILPVVTDGEWAWDPAAGDFSAGSTAVPDALRGIFDEEPLFLDLRWARGGEQLSLQHNRFRDAIAQLAAPMHGVSKDELEGEDVRQHRRVKRLRSGAVATLAVLALVAAMTGVSAVRNADRARDAAAEALRQEQVANEQRGSAEWFAEEAKRQQERAVQEQKRAADASALAQQQEDLAKDQQMLAELASAEAERQQKLAGDATERTREQQKLAQQQSDRAKRLSQKADDLAAEAERQSQLAKDEQKRAEEAADEAGRQRANAEQQQKIAVSRQLLNKAGRRIVEDPRTALMLSAAAQSIHPAPETLSAAAGVVTSTQWAGTISNVAMATYAPDGVLATVGNDGVVALWDVSVPLKPNRLATVGPVVREAGTRLSFSPDGKTLVIHRLVAGVVLWDVTDRREPAELSALPDVFAAAISPDGRTLAAGYSWGEVVLWDITDRARPEVLWKSGESVEVAREVAFSSDGKLLVVGMGPRYPIYDVSDRSHPVLLRSNLDRYGIGRVAASPTKLVVAGGQSQGYAGSSAGSGILMDLSLLSETEGEGEPDEEPNLARGRLFGLTDDMWALAFNVDGSRLAAGDAQGAAVVWDVSDMTTPRQVTSVRTAGPILAVTLSPDGDMLVTTDRSGNATLWNVAETAAPGHLAGLTAGAGPAHALAFGPDGRSLSTITQDATASFWNVADPARPVPAAAAVTHTGPVLAAAYSRDRRMLAAVDGDGLMTLTDLTDPARPIRLATTDLGVFGPIAVAFSPDGGTLAVRDDNSGLQIWDLTVRTRPTLRSTRDTGVGPGQALGFSPDGRTLATSGADRTATLWDVTGRSAPARLATLTGHTEAIYSVAFSPDGRTLVTGSADPTAIIWNVTDRRRPHRLATLTGPSSAAALAISPDGRTLATGGEDGSATVWDIADRSGPTRLTGVLGVAPVVQVAFSPDGRTIAAAGQSADGRTTVDVWDYSGLNKLRADPAGAACRIAGRGLTTEEWAQFVPELSYRETCRR